MFKIKIILIYFIFLSSSSLTQKKNSLIDMFASSYDLNKEIKNNKFIYLSKDSIDYVVIFGKKNQKKHSSSHIGNYIEVLSSKDSIYLKSIFNKKNISIRFLGNKKIREFSRGDNICPQTDNIEHYKGNKLIYFFYTSRLDCNDDFFSVELKKKCFQNYKLEIKFGKLKILKQIEYTKFKYFGDNVNVIKEIKYFDFEGNEITSTLMDKPKNNFWEKGDDSNIRGTTPQIDI
jgi:hypothetical protein